MADYDDNDLRYYADRLDAVLHQFTGMGAGTTSSTGTSGFGRNKTAFHKSMDKATEGLEFMHGSAMTAGHALRNFLGVSAISGIVTAVVHSMTDMYQTFSKLTDVGFNFSGSMLEMQKQAGDSGLSLDEFARSLGRSSTVVAQMGDAQTQGTKQFADFQKQVRNNLKEFGYYGMTLSQVDDASGDYLDNLRRAGQLTGLTTKQEAGASQEFIANVNAMAAATGKSREEIMKLTTQALHDPAAAARLSELGFEATKSFLNTAAVLSSSMGQAGVDMSHMFAQTIGAKGRTWATDMGDTAIKVGLPGFNSLMEQMADATTSGKPITRDLFDQMGQMRDLVQSHVDSLLDLRMNPEARAGVDKMLAWLEEMQGYDPARAFARSQQAQKDHDEGVTQAAALFETNLHDITGAFRSGLYKGILDMIAPGKNVKDQITAFSHTVDTLKGILKDVGTVVGKIFGLLIDAVTPATWIFKQLVSVLGGVQMAIEGMLKPFGMGQGAGTPVWEQDENGKDKLDDSGQRIPVWDKDEDGKDIVGKQATIEATNYAKIFSSTITVGLAGLAALWIKRRIRGKMHMAARDVYIAAKGVFGPKGQPMFAGGGAGGGGVGGLGNGTGGVKGAAPVGRLARMRARLSGGGGFMRGVLGFAAGELLNGMISLLPDFTGKDTIEEIVPWASSALNIFAPQFVAGILGRVAGMFVKGASATGGLLSRMSGFVKTGFTSFMDLFNKIPIPRMPFGAGLLGRLSAAVTGGFRSIVTGIGGVFTRTFSGIGSSIVGMFRGGGGLLKGIGSVFTRMFSGIGASIAGMFRGGGGLLKMGGGLLRGGGILKLVGRGLIGGLVSLLIDPFLNLFGSFTGKATLSSMATYGGIGASIGSLFAGVGAIPGAIVGGIIGILVENFNSLIGNIGSILKESWVGASAWVKSFFDGILDWFHDQLFGEDPAKKIKDAKKDVAGGKSWWRYILGLDDAKTPATEAAGKAAAGAMGPNPIDQVAMQGMYEQLPGMLAAGMRIDPLGSGGGADRYDAFAKAIVDVQNDTAKAYLTPPLPTDTFETLNQRLLDTMALISIDQEKNAKAPDPKLDIEIQKAQLEQLQLQNALIARGNSLQQDANRVSPWQ